MCNIFMEVLRFYADGATGKQWYEIKFNIFLPRIEAGYLESQSVNFELILKSR